jgi:hypothetical protein
MNIINAIFKFFVIIAPIILSGILALLAYRYWKESRRSAKVQLFEAFNRILDDKYKEFNKLSNMFIKYMLKQDRISVKLFHANLISIINQIKSLSKVYDKIVSDIDYLYEYGGDLVSAIKLKNDIRNRLSNEVSQSMIEAMDSNLKTNRPMDPDFYKYCTSLINEILEAVSPIPKI